LTYEAFIEVMQRLPLEWNIRKWTMLLWARYLGLDLSEGLYCALSSTNREFADDFQNGNNDETD